MYRGKQGKRDLLILAVVLVLVSAYYLLIQQGTPALQFSKDRRTVGFSGSKNTGVVFSFDTIEEITLVNTEGQGYGTPAEGGGTTTLGGFLYGPWHSEAMGDYQAFVAGKIPVCVLIRDGEKAAAFNTTNKETTANLCEQLVAFWKGELGE